ncbi:hypothetical protein PybrP1_000740 [[Pythium] brassicae (nom. inval.)]|nr:hypothetical protein PybrP1_000740 [[Pythium] brassicae (nom. inval.)]
MTAATDAHSAAQRLDDSGASAIVLQRLAASGPGKQLVDFPDAALRFSSRFDGGSVLRVTRAAHDAFALDLPQDAPTSGVSTGYTTWFYFEVRAWSAAKPGTDTAIDNVGREIRLEITNMNGQKGLYANGYSVLFCSVDASACGEDNSDVVERIFDDETRWKRLPTPLAFQKHAPPTAAVSDGAAGDDAPPAASQRSKAEVKVRMAFSHRFQFADERVRFAFCYPYSYSKLQRKLAALDANHVQTALATNWQQPAGASIYYHRELLTRSVEGLRVDLLTISSMDGVLAPTAAPDELSTAQPVDHHSDNRVGCRDSDSALAFDPARKRTVMISARVHPAETPASFMLDGMLALLLHPTDEGAVSLRNHFVFKIIPMLNPDGVAQGFYRTDTRGVNLNRVYQDPSPEFAPTVFAARALLLRIVDAYGGGGSAQAQNSVVYLDLHAHANRRGCFVYGNSLLESVGGKARQLETQLFARLVALNTPYFDYLACSFDKENMSRHDLRDNGNATTSREGSSRVALYQATGLTYVYTIECNYNEGRRSLRHAPTQASQPLSSGESGSRTGVPSPGLRRSLSQSSVDRAAASAGGQSSALARHVVSAGGTRLYMKYSPAEWTDVGIGSLVALLDLFQLQGRSKRVEESPFRSLEGVRKSLWAEIKSAGLRASGSTSVGSTSSTGSGSSGTGREVKGRRKSVATSPSAAATTTMVSQTKRPSSKM